MADERIAANEGEVERAVAIDQTENAVDEFVSAQVSQLPQQRTVQMSLFVGVATGTT
jgi:hypothetical protein